LDAVIRDKRKQESIEIVEKPQTVPKLLMKYPFIDEVSSLFSFSEKVTILHVVRAV